MSNKYITLIKAGAIRGFGITILISLVLPLFFDMINIFSSLLAQQKVSLTFLAFPGMYIAATLLIFALYTFPCVVIGIALELAYSTKKVISRLVFIFITGVTTYFIWSYFFVVFSSILYPTIFSAVIVVLLYFCFFVWWKPSH